MLEESHPHDDKEERPLLDVEKAILRALLGSNQNMNLDNLRVMPIGDTGMPSISFLNADQSVGRFGKEIGQAIYADADGVPVSISLSADDTGRLFELDFWKVDFNPLKKYPEATELEIGTKKS